MSQMSQNILNRTEVRGTTMFKPVWQPIIPMRWHKKEGGDLVLQQAWALYVMGENKWEQTMEYRWEDVPIDIDDPKYWSKES